MIALRERRHAGAHVDDDTGAFVSEDDRKEALGVGARARELVRVADAGSLDLDQHFAGARPVEVDGFDDQRLAGLVAHGGASLHGRSPGTMARSVTHRRGWLHAATAVATFGAAAASNRHDTLNRPENRP